MWSFGPNQKMCIYFFFVLDEVVIHWNEIKLYEVPGSNLGHDVRPYNFDICQLS